jgi:DNA-binding transcriptional MocR family regulator
MRISALRFLYKRTLERKDLAFDDLIFPKAPHKLPTFRGFRCRTDFRNSSFDQAVLCDFLVDGHLACHLRRMRKLYAERLATLMEGAKQHLGGLLEISIVRAGLYTIGYLKNGMT